MRADNPKITYVHGQVASLNVDK